MKKTHGWFRCVMAETAIMLALWVAVVTIVDCAWWKANGAVVTTDAGQIAACVVLHDNSDPDPTYEGIAKECGDIAVSLVEQIIESLVGAGATGIRPARHAATAHHAAPARVF